jgi:hypothetical protein
MKLQSGTVSRHAFVDREAARCAGYNLAIKSGTKGVGATKYAQSFADAAIKNGQVGQTDRGLVKQQKERVGVCAYVDREAAVCAGYNLAIKSGTKGVGATKYAQSFADAAVKIGQVAQVMAAPAAQIPVAMPVAMPVAQVLQGKALVNDAMALGDTSHQTKANQLAGDTNGEAGAGLSISEWCRRILSLPLFSRS